MMSARTSLQWALALAAALLSIETRNAAAQLSPSMIPDRPSQISTLSSPGMVQVESGVSYEQSRQKDDHPEISNNSWLVGMLLRAGMLETMELRIGFEYVNEMEHTGGMVEHGFGLRNISIGTKISLVEEDGMMPALSLFANAHLPFGQDDYRPRELIPGLRLQADYDVNHSVMLTGNIGGEWAVGSPCLLTSYTTTVAVPLTDRLSAFGDLGGQFSSDDVPAHAWDIGLMIAFHDRLQLDLAGGCGITPAAPSYFFSSGFSYRVP
jgi:hypothetical protein